MTSIEELPDPAGGPRGLEDAGPCLDVLNLSGIALYEAARQFADRPSFKRMRLFSEAAFEHSMAFNQSLAIILDLDEDLETKLQLLRVFVGSQQDHRKQAFSDIVGREITQDVNVNVDFITIGQEDGSEDEVATLDFAKTVGDAAICKGFRANMPGLYQTALMADISKVSEFVADQPQGRWLSRGLEAKQILIDHGPGFLKITGGVALGIVLADTFKNSRNT